MATTPKLQQIPRRRADLVALLGDTLVNLVALLIRLQQSVAQRGAPPQVLVHHPLGPPPHLRVSAIPVTAVRLAAVRLRLRLRVVDVPGATVVDVVEALLKAIK